jgi:ribonuclease BN (tRNA processing enzyme)
MEIILRKREVAKETPPVQPPIRLENDGCLEISFIGAGSAFSKKHFQNNVLLVQGPSHVLVDCGSRAPEALALLGLSVTDITTYLVTHSHADHIGGLEEVMLQNRYRAHRRSRIILTDKMRHILWGTSLRGGAAFNEVHDGEPLRFEDFFEQLTPRRHRGADRELSSIDEGPLHLDLFRTKHIPDSSPTWATSFPSYGLVIDGRVLFTSDSRYDPEMILDMERRFGIEAIFHDCQDRTGGVHASLEELSGLPPETRAKTRLMHYGDEAEKLRERAEKLGFAGLAEEWATYRFEV